MGYLKVEEEKKKCNDRGGEDNKLTGKIRKLAERVIQSRARGKVHRLVKPIERDTNCRRNDRS